MNHEDHLLNQLHIYFVQFTWYPEIILRMSIKEVYLLLMLCEQCLEYLDSKFGKGIRSHSNKKTCCHSRRILKDLDKVDHWLAFLCYCKPDQWLAFWLKSDKWLAFWQIRPVPSFLTQIRSMDSFLPQVRPMPSFLTLLQIRTMSSLIFTLVQIRLMSSFLIMCELDLWLAIWL